jgi:hypothetical protein
MACFGILQNKVQLESENAVLEIVGREGDEYETRGSVRAAESPTDPRYNTWVDHDDLKRTVTKFPTIKDKYALADKILKLKAEREEEERRRKTNFAYGVKHEPAGIPEVAKPDSGTVKASGK